MSTVRIGQEEFEIAADGTITLDTSALDRVWPQLPDVLVNTDGRGVLIRAEGFVFRDAGALRRRMRKADHDAKWFAFQEILAGESFDPEQEWPAPCTPREYGTDRRTGQKLFCFSGYQTRYMAPEQNSLTFHLNWFRERREALVSSATAMWEYINGPEDD